MCHEVVPLPRQSFAFCLCRSVKSPNAEDGNSGPAAISRKGEFLFLSEGTPVRPFLFFAFLLWLAGQSLGRSLRRSAYFVVHFLPPFPFSPSSPLPNSKIRSPQGGREGGGSGGPTGKLVRWGKKGRRLVPLPLPSVLLGGRRLSSPPLLCLFSFLACCVTLMAFMDK